MTSNKMVELVDFNESHIDRTFLWVSDPFLQRTFLIRGIPTRAVHEAYFRTVLKDCSQKVYAILCDGIHIGNCGLKHLDPSLNLGELWIYIGEKAYRRSGIGKYATHLLCRKSFEQLHLEKVFVHVAESNIDARMMYRNLGFIVDNNPDTTDEWRDHTENIIKMVLNKP